jgi:hypothetical protein
MRDRSVPLLVVVRNTHRVPLRSWQSPAAKGITGEFGVRQIPAQYLDFRPIFPVS